MFKGNLVPFLISFIISAGVSIYFYPVWLYMIVAFLICWCVQLLLTMLIGRTLWWNKKLKVEQLINERVNKIYSQYITIQCCNGNCEHKFAVPVRFDQENIVECPNCHTKNKILLNATVVKSEHDQFRL